MPATPTVEALLKEWIEAFNSHDLDRHMALYTDDATLFGSVDDLQIGKAAIRAYFGNRPPGMRVRRYDMPHLRNIAPGIAVTAGHVDFADGEAVSPYRMTWVLASHDGNWRITQHHGSPRRGV